MWYSDSSAASSSSALSESPPCSKKSWRNPTSSSTSSSANSAATRASISSRGGTYSTGSTASAVASRASSRAIDLAAVRARGARRRTGTASGSRSSGSVDEPAPQVAHRDGLVGDDHHVGDELRGAAGPRHCRDHGLPHRVERHEGGLDAHEIDALAPHLHPVVDPSEQLQATAGMEPAAVGDAHPPRAVGRGRVHALVLGRVPPVAERDVGPRHHHLARLALGELVAVVVDDDDVLRSARSRTCRGPG